MRARKGRMAVLDQTVDEAGAAAGDDAPIALLETHSADLYRRVCVLVGGTAYVEDIVQETMVQALSCFGRYDRSRPLGPWLFGIALNVTRRYWRRVRHARAAAEVLAGSAPWARPAADPERELLLRERVDLLYRALDELTPRVREAFVLREIEQLPAEEVARLTRTSVAAVYTRVCRAREAIRAYVDGACGPEERKP
ncbi:MAG: RNA polymerase sigma factor [Myxococcota bacterium]|nr:RNA polymerase sigma factor [Myxococcota bacterium]